METSKRPKRLVKPNNKYINEHFDNDVPEQHKKVKVIAGSINKTSTGVVSASKKEIVAGSVSKKKLVTGSVSERKVVSGRCTKIVADLGPKKKTIETVAEKKASKTVADKKTSRSLKNTKGRKFVKYYVDCTEMGDAINICDFRKFLFEKMTLKEKENKSPRKITVKEQAKKMLVKCNFFMEKSFVRALVKTYLKSVNLVHVTKVSSSSKISYQIRYK